MFLVILAEVLFWSLFIFIVSSETMRIQRRRTMWKISKSRINGRKCIDSESTNYDDTNRLSGERMELITSEDEREKRETFNHRYNKRHGSHDLRKHLRSMKWKYHQNHQNLLLFCHYKRISDKYYASLRNF